MVGTCNSSSTAVLISKPHAHSILSQNTSDVVELFCSQIFDIHTRKGTSKISKSPLKARAQPFCMILFFHFKLIFHLLHLYNIDSSPCQHSVYYYYHYLFILNCTQSYLHFDNTDSNSHFQQGKYFDI